MGKSLGVKRTRIDLTNVRGFDVQREKSVGYLLRESSRAMVRELAALIAQHDVTPGQYFIMRELWDDDGITQRELSDRIGLFENSTTIALAAMEKRGLIERRRSDTDKRKIHIYLSARGRRLRDVLLGYAAEVNEVALAGMTTSEIDTLRTLLRRVRNNLSAHRRREE